MKEFIEAGKIVTNHGIKGEIKLYPWCDDLEMFGNLETVFLDSKGEKAVKIESSRVHKNMVLIKFVGVDSIEDAVKYRDKTLYVHRDNIPMEEGEYLIQDLIGLTVLDVDSGKEYGRLSDVSQTGANDVYHIQFPDGKERLIPVIPQVVIKTSLEEGRMLIRPLKGLFDDED